MQGFSGGSNRLFVISFAIGVLAASTILSPISAIASDDGVASSIKKAPATHKQKAIIKVANTKAGEKLEDFCIDAKGQILALLGPANQGQVGSPDGDDDDEDNSITKASFRRLNSTGKKQSQFASAVHVFGADGKLASKWPVGFSGQSINTAPDGTILIGGDGRIARFDANGEKLYEAESPQMTYISKNPDEMRERAIEQLESDRATYAEKIKTLEGQLEELKEAKKKEKVQAKQNKRKGNVDDDSQINEQNISSQISSYNQRLRMIENQTVEQVLNQVLGRAKRIHAIGADEKNVFVTCAAMAGYGYGVWRTDEKFEQAKEIVKRLSGCCGQMDVQCRNGEIYVCENSRHRVIRFDRDGKEIGHFGKRDREGDGENFGGCCNPMNLCFSKDGNLFVSESNGVVKHFTPGGEYLGIVGIAGVQAGCKNSCVGVTTDDSRLFYIDIHKSQIIVLTRNDASENK